ncbi:MAG: hypothetical protein K0U39_07140 [Alphaproteobacteria bacterium]|nr:hypothetical protein [Alphaproteobacteria bacterium]
MVSTVSTAGKVLFNIRNIHRQQEVIADKAIQYQTGQKYQEISKYGKDLPIVLSYRQEIQQTTRLLANNEAVINNLKTTDTVLERFEDIIGTLRTALEQGLGFDSRIDPASYTNWRDANQTQADDVLHEITDLLNSRVGRRYLFSGTRYDTRPVTRLDQLDDGDFYASAGPPSVPLTFAEFNPDRSLNEIPDYDANSTPNIIPSAPPLAFDVDADSYRSNLFHTGEASVREYGVSSNDETLTRIIYAARSYKQALQEPDQATRENFLRAAIAEIETADGGLQVLRQREGARLQNLLLLKDNETELNTFRENYLAELVTVDRETISIQYAALNQQVQANFTLIAQQSRLSLANYF